MGSLEMASESPERVSCVSAEDAAYNKRVRGAAIPLSSSQKAAALRQRQRAMIEGAGLSHKGLGPVARAKLCKEIDAPNQKARRDRQAHVKRLHHARLRCAMPPWADVEAIRAIYDEARRLTAETGIPHEVDHIEPLLGANFCGLHVEYNLRVITRTENRRKGNRRAETSGA